MEKKRKNDGKHLFAKDAMFAAGVMFARSVKQRDSPADTDKQGNCR